MALQICKFSYIAMFSANVTMKHFFLEDFTHTVVVTYVPMLGLVFVAVVELMLSVLPSSLPKSSIPVTKFLLVSGDV